MADSSKWSPAVKARLATLTGSWKERAAVLTREFGFQYKGEQLRKLASYHGEGLANAPDNAAKVEAEPPARDLASQVLGVLKAGASTTIGLREKFGCSARELDEAVRQLREEGFMVAVDKPLIELRKAIPVGDRRRFDIAELYNGGWFNFGFVTDNHLGSRYERLDVLNAAYDHFAAEKIAVVYNAGNVIDGYIKKINEFDLHPGLQGYTAQVDYFVRNYPQRPGVTTYFITGDDHEGWWVRDSGINIGEYMQLKAEAAGRTDLKWVGHMEFDFILPAKRGNTVIRLVHPGGGSSYATSYTMQKLVESYQGGEKPSIVLAGHYHKADLNYIRNVWAIQGGCTEDQTPFMRKKRLAAHVGFWTAQFHQAADGAVSRLRGEFFPFYDRGYYERNDHYKMW